jgi:N-acetyl-anhydromuramyl-L-alanine amidase AmpD
MSTLPGIAYLHALGDGGPRSRTQVVVIHATDSTASAHDEASYATHRPDQTSAHFYVDGGGIYEALQLENVAYGCLWHGNQISVQFELCGRSNQLPNAVLRKAAPYVAEVCRRFGIPVRKISAGQVAAGVKGICGHADITAAFPQDGGDHTDPGSAFPWGTFINYVGGGQPAPAANSEDDDMAKRVLIRKQGTSAVYLTNGMGRWWIQSQQVLTDVKGGAAQLTGVSVDGAIHDVADLDAFGPLIGPGPTA